MLRRYGIHGLAGIGGISPMFGVSCPQAGGCTFELLARFDVANQVFINGQVLGVPEGVDVGSLTIVDTAAGVVQVTATELDVDGSGNWQQTGFISPIAIARALGKTFLFDNLEGNVSAFFQIMAGWHINPPPVLLNNDFKAGIFFGGNSIYVSNPLSLVVFTPVPFVATTFDAVAVVLGGYDINGVPWDDSQVAANYLYGYAVFLKWAGTFDTWTLLYRSVLRNDDPVYPALNVRYPDAANNGVRSDNYRVPTYDYSAVLQPTIKDTFTDPNGTSLDAHAPDISSGGWTEQNGDWDIQGNRANVVNDTGGAPRAIATVAGLADFFGRTTVNLAAGTAGSLLYRYSNNNNFWYMDLNNPANRWAMIERNGGVENVRDQVVVIPVLSATDYEITVVTDGTSHAGYWDGGNRLSFVSAFNQAATGIGSRSQNGVQLDNFHVQPRDNYDELDNCP